MSAKIGSLVLLLTLFAGTAVGDVVYSNGAPTGQYALAIYAGYSISDDFTLNTTTHLTGFTFYTMNQTSGITWSIAQDNAGAPGTTLFSGNSATSYPAFPDETLGVNSFQIQFNVSQTLGPGTYWLTLGDALIPSYFFGYGDYWLTTTPNSSYLAYLNGNGFNNAHYFLDYGAGVDQFAFDVEGSQVPEPASMILLGSGLATLAGVCRKKVRH